MSTFVYDDSCTGSVSAGSISVAISSLSASTTYYFRAFVAEYNERTGAYEYRYGEVKSFTTAVTSTDSPSGWLELPASSGNADYTGVFYSSGTSAANRNYSYTYSYTWYASMWVAYPLAPAHLKGNAPTSGWDYNPEIDRDYQVNIVSNSYGTMYGASSYSRGHQVPNADRKSNSTMNAQTYYSTNQTPQLQNSFNGSIWESLEDAVRTEVNSYADTVYVVTGPCFQKVGGSESITYLTGVSEKNANPSSLPVANYFWKALLKVTWGSTGGVKTVTDASAIGFWFEHKAYSSDSYTNYAVSVDQIEAWTGLDLFTNLPSSVQSKAEANASWEDFKDFR